MEAGAIWVIFSFENIIKIELIMADAPQVVITSKQRNALSWIERQETDLERIKLYNSQFYREQADHRRLADLEETIFSLTIFHAVQILHHALEVTLLGHSD